MFPLIFRNAVYSALCCSLGLPWLFVSVDVCSVTGDSTEMLRSVMPFEAAQSRRS